jgi:hypothetical protein
MQGPISLRSSTECCEQGFRRWSISTRTSQPHVCGPDLDDVARADIHRLADVRHGPDVIRRLIVAIARSVASDVAFTTLTADVRAVAPSINARRSVRTSGSSADIRRRSTTAMAPALRSRAVLRTAAKLHLVDPALAAAALGADARANCEVT